MKYYAYHPRRFANEYTVIAAETPADVAALDDYARKHDNAMLYRVTVRELRRMRTDERRARREGPAFSGYCNPFTAISVNDFLHPAAY